MASADGYLGSEFLLKLESATTPGVFTTVGGMRSNDLDRKNASFDTTTKDGATWTTKIAGGQKSMTVSGAGVWKNQTTQKAALTVCESGAKHTWQIVDASGNEWEGDFIVTGYKVTGNHDGIQEFSLTLESAGVIEFTAGAA
jgi:TP901-1 family phage major tail protein